VQRIIVGMTRAAAPSSAAWLVMMMAVLLSVVLRVCLARLAGSGDAY
jgi:hypothetical protein